MVEIMLPFGTRLLVRVNLPQSFPKKRTSQVLVILSLTKNMKSQMNYPLSERSSTTKCWKRLSLVPISRSSISITYLPATRTWRRRRGLRCCQWSVYYILPVWREPPTRVCWSCGRMTVPVWRYVVPLWATGENYFYL